MAWSSSVMTPPRFGVGPSRVPRSRSVSEVRLSRPRRASRVIGWWISKDSRPRMPAKPSPLKETEVRKKSRTSWSEKFGSPRGSRIWNGVFLPVMELRKKLQELKILFSESSFRPTSPRVSRRKIGAEAGTRRSRTIPRILPQSVIISQSNCGPNSECRWALSNVPGAASRWKRSLAWRP